MTRFFRMILSAAFVALLSSCGGDELAPTHSLVVDPNQSFVRVLELDTDDEVFFSMVSGEVFLHAPELGTGLRGHIVDAELTPLDTRFETPDGRVITNPTLERISGASWEMFDDTGRGRLYDNDLRATVSFDVDGQSERATVVNLAPLQVYFATNDAEDSWITTDMANTSTRAIVTLTGTLVAVP